MTSAKRHNITIPYILAEITKQNKVGTALLCQVLENIVTVRRHRGPNITDFTVHPYIDCCSSFSSSVTASSNRTFLMFGLDTDPSSVEDSLPLRLERRIISKCNNKRDKLNYHSQRYKEKIYCNIFFTG